MQESETKPNDIANNVIPECHDNSTWSIGVGTEHNRIAVGSNTHSVQIHDCSNKDKDDKFQVLRLQGHENNVPCVAYHPLNENIIASASIDATIRVWDISDRYNVKCTKINFRDIITTGGGHDIWMWSVEWISTEQHGIMYLDVDVVNKMRHTQWVVLEYLKRRRIWNREIEQLKQTINRMRSRYFGDTHNSNVTDGMMEIAKDMVGRVSVIIAESGLS